MKIHSDKLTAEDMHAAAQLAGAGFHRLEVRGSRSRARAFDFILEGSGAPGNSGRYGASGEYMSASWDAWGIALGEMFRRDPAATVPGVYVDAEHFRWSTGARFDSLTPAGIHRRHRWAYDGTSATGAYSVSTCKCGAVRRFVAYGHAWQELAS